MSFLAKDSETKEVKNLEENCKIVDNKLFLLARVDITS
jgi:hypothetical protein